jgi:putative glutamine amidotransferase
VNRVLVSFRNVAKATPYFDALRAAGLEPVWAVPSERVPVAGVTGLLLTGGSDIAPAYYGQEPDPQLGEVDAERDAYELGLLALADAVDLPVLCICRGLQLLNVHRGGTLIQHLSQTPRHRESHEVTIDPDSRLAAILGANETRVNSRHHQAIDRLGAGLAITARDAEDGVIEAVEDQTRRFLIAVQWHPEDLAPIDETQRRLFTAFAAAGTR